MQLDYAVDRLYQTGWTPGHDDQKLLPDGRRYPSVDAVRKAFARAGLTIQIAHNPKFAAYRATWSPTANSRAKASGTVIGASEEEAAVYALAQLTESLTPPQLVGA